ncbi:hypothetical protein ACGFYY_21090 [Streptomyces sp. NPDC048331]|uniref:hypothetical protein n=1 Tax=Streptomyces sp. NPDC048331 TaxID=3365534 RepID=UPI003713E956
MEVRPGRPPQVSWHDVDSYVFPYAARSAGSWLVLRLNTFPDHPLCTLFVDGEAMSDLEEVPAGLQLGPRATLPRLAEDERAEVLRLMAGLAPYGAETGFPCTGDFCTCLDLTDEFAARPTTSRRTSADQP